MIHANARFSEVVEEAVGAIEARTDAELVIVAAGHSGTYRDVTFAAACAAALLLLVALLYAPIVVTPAMVLVEIVGFWVLSAWLLSWPRLIRLMTSRERMERQVRAAAEAEFVREAVYATPQRTGVLVYVSSLEGRVEVIADVGIEGRVPPGLWRKALLEFSHGDLDHFVRGLHRVGEVLAEHVPPVDDPNRLELPDAPRVRP